MNWNMNIYYEFVSKVLNHKEDYKGEQIGKYVFTGAGQECIRLENENELVFVSYEDVLNEEEGAAKAVFDFFFNEEKESEETSDSTNNLSEQDKEDLETYLQKRDMDLEEFLFNNNSFKKYLSEKEVKLHISGANNASIDELLRFHLKAGRIIEKCFENVNNVECIIDIEDLIKDIKSTQDGAFYAEVVESNGFINLKFNFNTNAQLVLTQIIGYVEQIIKEKVI